MAWPVDEVRLERVRRAMEEADLDAIVVRAPDNIHYLTNYWAMKAWEIAILPRQGPPVLLAVEPQEPDVRRTAWTDDIVFFKGFNPDDARPSFLRALEKAIGVLTERGLTRRIGVETSNAVQSPERMTGEPTVYWKGYFDDLEAAIDEVVDCTPMLTRLRMIKTDQEVERLRITNDLAAEAVAHVRDNIRVGMKDAEVGSMYEGYVHSHGIGYRDTIDMARAFTLVWSGESIQTFTATKNTVVQDGAPTLMEIWTCADGYWNDLTKNAAAGPLSPEYNRLTDLLLGIFDEAVRDYVGPGVALADLDQFIRARTAEGGYPGQPSHYVCHGVGSRAHEPPWAHPLVDQRMEPGMVLAVEPGIYWDGGGGLRLEDNFLITDDGAEKLCSAPEDFRR
ncbi:MAG: aminopeptidase P family protein [Acidimicrobiia bacterium]|nr:Xaa-Pro peptidase family protein [Acidimicrobiia bacterium]NNF10619.1 aminopeptidase P family protein [Acidimicrobiia bacterium]NNL69683.1 aminopeptidase P family protein [Acidimicrobiia bacterium]